MPDPGPDPRPDPEPPAGAPGGTGGRGDPHRSRLRALKVLFQADLRGEDPRVWLERVDEDPAARALLEDADTDDHPVAVDELDAFSRRLVDGVGEHLGDIDAVLEEHSHHWPVHRMAALDRNVLRLGVYELRHEDTPPAVVIDEAIELAKALSTDDSRRFVNGVLEAVRAAEAGEGGGAGGGSGGV